MGKDSRHRRDSGNSPSFYHLLAAEQGICERKQVLGVPDQMHSNVRKLEWRAMFPSDCYPAGHECSCTLPWLAGT